ncbi:MAG: exosome complex RNA-binding protein Csl4 [Methanosarcinales archaeon]|jgi:exosome complex component CSL4|nr:exosome complex RNA-binding protein Csl4 [Methanosarcinales archaeon]
MSRVQKKPIRRKLKDAAGKAEESPASEPIERIRAAPAEDFSKSRIPRKPRPEVISKPEADAPANRAVRRTVRPTAETAEERPAEKPRRASSFSERSDKPNGFGRTGGNGSRGSDSRGSGSHDSRGSGDRSNRGRDRGGKGSFGGRKPAEKKKRPEKIVYEKTKQFVFPGDIVSAIEEYKPGFGTVNDDGTVRATVSGVIGINKEHRVISVIPKTKTLNMITEGDIVIASVTDVRESNARVDIVAAEKSLGEEIVNNGNAEIYVSNIKDGFAKSVADEFGVGDIVRAKVIDSRKIGLSTVESEFGVLKAYCSKCKTSLTKGDDGLVCGNCGNREKRKLAEGYGKGIASALPR